MQPHMREEWVMHHQVVQNFIFAQKMVVARLDSSTTFWPPQSYCGEAGAGVWYATGTVETVATAGVPVAWKTLFIPGAPQPLYLRIGSHEWGDYSAALARAGLPPATP